MDRKRRCGFLADAERGPLVTVWTGGGVGVTECPKPIISSFSLMCLEGFFAMKVGKVLTDVEGKVVDGWQVLAEELRKEEHDD